MPFTFTSTLKRLLVATLFVGALGMVGLRVPAYAQKAHAEVILLSCLYNNGSWKVATVDVFPADSVVPDVRGCVDFLNAAAMSESACRVNFTLDQTGNAATEVLHMLTCNGSGDACTSMFSVV